MVDDAVVVEAACAIRPYLPELLEDEAHRVDSELASLLEVAPRPPGIAAQLRTVLEGDEVTREWFKEFLDDPMHVPPALQEVRDYSPKLGNRISVTRYRCPDRDDDHYVWYRRTLADPVPTCPAHGCRLVSP